jgi:hypothetical protein
MKKIKISLLVLVLSLIFSFSISALKTDQLTPNEDFYIYSASPQKVAEILEMTKEGLKSDIESKGIIFLAVDKENSRQIQLTETENKFSTTISNLSNLSDSSIRSLLPDITGIENIKGKIVLHGEQKYVRIELKSKEYILTQFFTVENKKLYTLSFYTNTDTSTEYIKNTFSYRQKTADSITLKEIPANLKTFTIIGFSVFAVMFLVILFTIIKDYFKKYE